MFLYMICHLLLFIVFDLRKYHYCVLFYKCEFILISTFSSLYLRVRYIIVFYIQIVMCQFKEYEQY
jgi:hypothetical protein